MARLAWWAAEFALIRRFGALEVGRLERSPGAQMARSCAAWSGAAAPAQPGARERDRLLAAGLGCAELRGSVASGTADRCSDVDLCWVVPDEMFAAAVEPPSGRSDPRVRWHRYASTPTSLSQTAPGSSASGWWALRCSGASISTSVQPPGSRRRLRCGKPRPRAANRDGRSQAAPWRPGLLRALPHRVRLSY